MEHHWLVRNENEGRRSGAAKQWTRPTHAQGREKSVGGVGLLVNKNIKDRVAEFRGGNSRVASLTIKISTSTIYLQAVHVYAPTSTHEDEEVEKFYEEVSKILSENKSYETLMLKWVVTSREMEQHFDSTDMEKETREGRD